MDENKWFRRLWRVNAVLILVVLVVGICAHSYRTVRGWFYEPYLSSNVRRVAFDPSGNAVLKAEWAYGDPKEVPGATGFIVPLERVFRKPDSSGYRGYRLTNLLFVDAGLKATRWLLPDNKRHIGSYQVLTRSKDGNIRTLAILYEIDQIEERPGLRFPRSSLYLSRPDGTGLVRVVEGVDRSISHILADENHLVVFYVKDNMGHAARIALSDFSVVASTKLQPIE